MMYPKMLRAILATTPFTNTPFAGAWTPAKDQQEGSYAHQRPRGSSPGRTCRGSLRGRRPGGRGGGGEEMHFYSNTHRDWPTREHVSGWVMLDSKHA